MRNKNYSAVIDASKSAEAQKVFELSRGITLRRTRQGVPVLRVHYSADPERDPEINPSWVKDQRAKYSSQGNWDREQEIVHNAGGGELVFAEVLSKYANKIVITDPSWTPSPKWKKYGGFDHGKTNPTAAVMAYVDYDGVIYFCGEYYQPGRHVHENASVLKQLPGFMEGEILADPTIFDKTMQQKDGTFAAVNDLYVEQGIEHMQPFEGNRSDATFAERLMQHWADLEHREPTVRIVCRVPYERPSHGLHKYDCPNLLWELFRTRKEKLTAQQLLHRNPSERIVDKDNHARDSCKHVVISLPEPAEYTSIERIQQRTKHLVEQRDITSLMIHASNFQSEEKESAQPASLGRRRRRLF